MEKLAVALWIMTAVGGAYMFGFTLRHGSRSAEARGTNFSSTLFPPRRRSCGRPSSCWC
jgi:hypothetical protein